MIHKRTENNIFLNINFVKKLMLLIPSKVLNYWGISITDINRIEGWIRYNDQDKIDAIYIYVRTKFIEIDEQKQNSIIKFIVDRNEYVYYSIYSRYDPIKEKIISPIGENTYDSDMNIIAKHVFITDIHDVNAEMIPTVIQYKNDKKHKEYFIMTETFPLAKLNELDNAGIITQEVKSTTDIIINRLGVYGENIKYYYIK